MAFKFRLKSETGEDLGPYEAITPTWAPGHTIPRGHDTLVVVSVTDAEPGDGLYAILVVKPA